ncbi:MAG: hypothetical protein AAFY16_02370 [Cyanobacteria bacterium J06642_3]
MFNNLTYFDWLIIASIAGGFFGTLLSWLTNFVYKTRLEEYDHRPILEGLLISIAMGLTTGGLFFGCSLFDSSIQDDGIRTIFIFCFLICLFSGSVDIVDILIKLAQQARAAILPSKDTEEQK